MKLVCMCTVDYILAQSEFSVLKLTDFLCFVLCQLINCFQSLLDAKLLTINSETLTPDSIVSLNLKYVENIVLKWFCRRRNIIKLV